MRNTARQLLPFLVSIIGGVTCTIMITIVAAFYSPQPTRFSFANEHTGKRFSEYLAFAAEIPVSERVLLMTSRGLGYRSIDVRYYKAAEIAKTDYPTAKRRAFKTELGWPNAAFSTNARIIGLRLGSALGPNTPSDDAALHDGKETIIQVLWSGFCLNSLLATTLILLPWVLFKRLTNYSITTRSIIASICAGLWLALITAWGCDLAHHVFRFLPSDYFGNSIGYNSIRIDTAKVLSLGWPAYSLKGKDIGPWQSIGDPWPNETKHLHIVSLMAMPVLWSGLMINWFTFSLLVLAITKGPSTVCRLHRRCHNRCLMCGYPIGESSRCSECGNIHSAEIS